jgi:hypothetical protein
MKRIQLFVQKNPVTKKFHVVIEDEENGVEIDLGGYDEYHFNDGIDAHEVNLVDGEFILEDDKIAKPSMN